MSRFSDLQESILKIVSDLDVSECDHSSDFREVDHVLIDKIMKGRDAGSVAGIIHRR